MSDGVYSDADNILLKECYTLAGRFETDDVARELISARSGAIRVSRDHLEAFSETSHDESVMSIFSRIIDSFSKQALDDTSDSYQGDMGYLVGDMPDGPEREYILALMSLRNRRDNEHRSDALRHLSNALAYDGNDPRFIALADILSRVGVR